MRYVCDAPGGKTWFRIETEAEAVAESETMRHAVELLDDLGIDNVMWASDYPHGDSTYPDSQEYIKRQFSHLPSATQRKITCENAGKFYGLIPQ